jgi:hypothetical protein
MNGFSRCSIMAGRVRIITSLWRTGDDRTLPLLPYRMDKVERGETVWKIGTSPEIGVLRAAKMSLGARIGRL